MRPFCLLILSGLVFARALQAGSGGNAVYLGDTHGLHVSSFPMPTHAVTIDLWVKFGKVRVKLFVAALFLVRLRRLQSS
jgi:hypothetical protein